jgi:hypothetical protein
VTSDGASIRLASSGDTLQQPSPDGIPDKLVGDNQSAKGKEGECFLFFFFNKMINVPNCALHPVVRGVLEPDDLDMSSSSDDDDDNDDNEEEEREEDGDEDDEDDDEKSKATVIPREYLQCCL